MDTFTKVQRYFKHTFSPHNQELPRNPEPSHSLEDIELAMSGSFPIERNDSITTNEVHVPQTPNAPPGSFPEDPHENGTTQESYQSTGRHEYLKIAGLSFLWTMVFFLVVIVPHLPSFSVNLNVKRGPQAHPATLPNLQVINTMIPDSTTNTLPVLSDVTAVSTSITWSNETAVSTVQQDDPESEHAEPHELLTDAQAMIHHAGLSAMHFRQFLIGDVYPAVKSVSSRVVNTLSDYIPAIPIIPNQARDNTTESSRKAVRTFKCKSGMCSFVLMGEQYEPRSDEAF